jgi:hypothetical protein
MRKEWILTDEEKSLKRRKIERNRLIKEQAQLAIRQQHHDTNFRTNNSSSSSTIEVRLNFSSSGYKNIISS